MVWAETLLSSFSYKNAAVVMDSYAGLFSPKVMTPTMVSWGFCDTPLTPIAEKASCESDVTVQDRLKLAMKRFPEVKFASIQSKWDHSQIWFYQGLSRSWGDMQGAGITVSAFVTGVDHMFEDYNAKHKNHRAYMINSQQHCYTQSSHALYAASPSSSDKSDAQVPLYQWLGHVASNRPAPSHCRDPMANDSGKSTSCPKITTYTNY